MKTSGHPLNRSRRHLAGVLGQLITDRKLTQLEVANKSSLDPAKLTRIRQDVHRCDFDTLTKLRKAFNKPDQALLIRAHIIDEVGLDGLQMVTGAKIKGATTLALTPQTLELLRQLEKMPSPDQAVAERTICELLRTLIQFRTATTS